MPSFYNSTCILPFSLSVDQCSFFIERRGELYHIEGGAVEEPSMSNSANPILSFQMLS